MRTPSATVGLVVEDGRVVMCPPYAIRWGVLGRDARYVWRKLVRRPGFRLVWVPEA